MDNSTSSGASIGALIALICSAAANHSFWWAILHMVCGWFYVLYFLFFKYNTVHDAIAVIKHLFGG